MGCCNWPQESYLPQSQRTLRRNFQSQILDLEEVKGWYILRWVGGMEWWAVQSWELDMGSHMAESTCQAAW